MKTRVLATILVLFVSIKVRWIGRELREISGLDVNKRHDIYER